MKKTILIGILIIGMFLVSSCATQSTPQSSQHSSEKETVQAGGTQVECTNNAACPGGMVCDLSASNYGKCVQQTGASYCGDGVCQRTETSNKEWAEQPGTSAKYCPEDCR